jgi:DNA-directed RNA polymerase specialized sigma24 family protein
MRLPDGVSEERFLEATNRVLNLLATKFVFTYHQLDDIKQQGMLFAIKIMATNKYDTARPLENFLYTHLRNQFINYKRDNYIRNEPPCLTCIFYDPSRTKSSDQCTAFGTKQECEKLQSWNHRNAVKRNIIQPIDVESVMDYGCAKKSDIVLLEMESQELERLIDDKLPMDMRADYLRLRAGEPVSKSRKLTIRNAVADILAESGDSEGEIHAPKL